MNKLSCWHHPIFGGTVFCAMLLAFAGCARDVVVKPAVPARAANLSGPAAPEAAVVSASLRVLQTRHDAADRQAATANLIDLCAPRLLAAPGHMLVVPSDPGHPLRITLRRGAGPGGMEPAGFTKLQPADRFRVVGKTGGTNVEGVGVPLVGSLQPLAAIRVPESTPGQPIVGGAWAITAVPVLRDGGLCLDLYDPHVTGKDGSGAPLAADYTTPSALVYSHFVRENRGLHGFLSGSSSYSSTGIYPTEKPCTNKTPLMLVHGLISDPTDFYRLRANLEKNPEFRRRYQVWVFYYPSSLPISSSARLLREDFEYFVHQLDPKGVHPALHRAVFVGHSMGGLLCRLTVSDGGQTYYQHFFTKPISELRLTPEQRDMVRRSFFYRACPDVKAVVFIATPHRGSALAGGFLGSIGRLMVRVPVTVHRAIHDITTNNRAALAFRGGLRPVTSLDALSPRDPLIAAVNEMPIHAGVGLHSVLGNSKRDGPREKSSDGVVPYASSHLPQAQSEILVPAGHTGTLKRPETAAEIERIVDR